MQFIQVKYFIDSRYCILQLDKMMMMTHFDWVNTKNKVNHSVNDVAQSGMKLLSDTSHCLHSKKLYETAL